MSTDTIAAQFSETGVASPNGEAEQAPANCRFEWVPELPARERNPSGPSAKKEWLSAAMQRLSERPGTWAMILSYDTPTTAASRIASLRKQFPGIDFDHRKLGESGGAVYARLPVAAG